MTQVFGGSVGWDVTQWIPINDQVRGGSSTSFVQVTNNMLRFYGHLDTLSLGGAGFASQRNDRHRNWSDFNGLIINIHSGEGKMYSVNVKVVDNDIEYRYSFDSKMEPISYNVNWKDFKPTYRGRQVPNAPKVDPSKVSSLSLMCSSYFDRQKGDFSLVVDSILLF